MYLFIRVDACVCMDVNTSTWKPEVSGKHLSLISLHPCFLRQNLFLSLKIIQSARLVVQCASWIPLTTPPFYPSQGNRYLVLYPVFFMWVLEVWTQVCLLCGRRFTEWAISLALVIFQNCRGWRLLWFLHCEFIQFQVFSVYSLYFVTCWSFHTSLSLSNFLHLFISNFIPQ